MKAKLQSFRPGGAGRMRAPECASYISENPPSIVIYINLYIAKPGTGWDCSAGTSTTDDARLRYV